MAKIRLEKFNGQYVLTVLVNNNDTVVIDNVQQPTRVWAPAEIIAKGTLESVIIKGDDNDTNKKK